MNTATVSLEIETCVGAHKEVAQVLLDAGVEKVEIHYPQGGAMERRSWPPTGAAEEILPHLPAILTATASTLITADYLRRIAQWFRDKRATDTRIPSTRLRIRRQEGREPLLDVELETVDPQTVEKVIASLLDGSDDKKTGEEES